MTHAVYKVGNPYQIDGQWYYPRANYSYDQTGIASWYGHEFGGDRTANGEIFNPDELTAAHRTLPMPSLARVTNLQNGRSIVVRINDRGPFARGRIIDVSRRAAQLLGFEQQGTAEVRVQVLARESEAIADAMRHYGRPAPVQMASAEAPPAMAAPRAPVTSESLDLPSDVQTRPQPVYTTPAIHRELVDTKPLPVVLHVPVPSHTHIFVQAGAFTVLENATKLQQNLTRFGPVSVSNASVNGRTFYRVRVGPMQDVAAADRMLARVQQAGVVHSRIVVD
ncbi:MAG TPA: septal ring lytic transglycosylase RlpA family protein [Alphaproteobacteria bacterium]|nr:septal ring lytic transglycosylase RlpA family protein [Alphaproteobacteria bacterium]